MVIWEEAAVRYLNSLGLEPEENLSEKIMTMSMEEGADYLIDHYRIKKCAIHIKNRTMNAYTLICFLIIKIILI